MDEFAVTVIDDSKTMLLLEKAYLKDSKGDVHTFLNPLDGVEYIKKNHIDLVIVDYMMPELDGLETIKRIKEIDKNIKIIMLTSVDDNDLKLKALEYGATDFLTKPISEVEFKTRVKNIKQLIEQQKALEKRAEILQHEVNLHVKKVSDREEETLSVLANVAEYRDKNTYQHIKRVANYSKILGKYYGLSETEQDILEKAAPLHDIGKIGVRDNILLKEGKLTDEEFKIMRNHTIYGYNILKNCQSPYLKAGALIALSHHEKWDGTGYPHQKKGEEIPLYGRIVAVADVFDALTAKRAYKKAWSLTDALSLIVEESGKSFDPKIVEVFLKASVEIFDYYNLTSEERE